MLEILGSVPSSATDLLPSIRQVTWVHLHWLHAALETCSVGGGGVAIFQQH